MESYLPRFLDESLADAVASHPAVMLVGPRGCGKTTSARRFAAEMVSLDIPARAALFAADADAALAAFTDRPLLLDEWQEVPGVIGAVKRAVDAGAPVGSFILTGSVRAVVSNQTWPGTGRIIELEMTPLARREIERRVGSSSLIDRLLAAELPLGRIADAPSIAGYVDLALAGGFPKAALRLDADASVRFYRSFVSQIATRDLASALRGANPDRFGAYLEAFALNTAGVTPHATLYRHAGVTRVTAEGYDAVLDRLYLASRVPAFSTNRLDRLVRMPKRFLADPALAAAAARTNRDDILRDGELLGRLIESFVFSQLKAELSALHPDIRLHHLRTEKGSREVDFLLTLGGGRLVGIEVKSAATVDTHDARHLAWLRDRFGDAFLHGVVLHTGPDAFPLGHRLSALPIAALWA